MGVTCDVGQTFGPRGEGRGRSLLPDPGRLLMVFRRRLRPFLGAAALVLSAVAVAVLSATPRYAATASVLIEPAKNRVIDLGSVVQGLPPDTNVVDTETQLIGSPTVALAVVRRLRLDRDPEFAGRPGGDARAPAGRGDASAAERLAMSALLGNVLVRRAGLTYVIDVTARSRDAAKAAAIANAFATQFIAAQARRKAAVTEKAATFVRRRADTLRAQAVADDAAVQRYVVAHDLMSADGQTMAEQEVSTLNQQIAQARADLASERGRLAAARGQLSRGGGADIAAVLQSDTTRVLREQEAVASAQLASLQARYGDRYPEVQKAKRTLSDVRDQLGAERGRIISGLQANVQVAASRLGSLEGSQSRSRGALASNGAAQVGLLELQRKAEASRAVYSAFLNRAKETSAAADLPQADASVSSPARPPDAPAWPNRRLAALLGVGAALLAGLLAVGAAEYLDGGIRTREQVEDALGAAYLGAIPDLASVAGRGGRGAPPQNYVLSHPFSAFAEALRTVGASLAGRGEGRAQVVAVTSPLPREGKTALAVCLARVLALGRRRVVLVDFDLRRHSATDLLLPGHEERLLRVLAGDLPVEEALVRDDATGLMILPTGGPTSAEDHAAPERVERLFAELRRQFDVVVVDTAPVLGVADTRVVARQADVTLLVCRWRRTAAQAAAAALDALDQAGAEVAGVALSMVDARGYASTGQADGYGHHRKFTGYYVN